MNDRAFRLDFFIAIAALLVSVLTTLTLIYQTHVIGEQYAATIWPYLSLNSTYNAHGQKLYITNEGLGPALIQSAQLVVDGKPVPQWSNYLKALVDQPSMARLFREDHAMFESGKKPLGIISTGSAGPGTTLRPGATLPLLDMEMPDYVPLKALRSHRISMEFCYCSLNGSCWIMAETADASKSVPPAPVGHCSASTAIDANGAMPSAPSARASAARR